MELYTTFEDGYTAENGVVVRWTDTGVRYTYKGKTLEFCGEYDCGEVWITDAEGTVLKRGDYERDDNDDTYITWEGKKRRFNAGCTEEEGEHVALKLLR